MGRFVEAIDDLTSGSGYRLRLAFVARIVGRGPLQEWNCKQVSRPDVPTPDPSLWANRTGTGGFDSPHQPAPRCGFLWNLNSLLHYSPEYKILGFLNP